MKNHLYRGLWLGLLFLCCFSSFAQDNSVEKIRGFSVSIFDEHVQLPFDHAYNQDRNIGGLFSFERSKKRSGAYQFTHLFQLGFYQHKDLHQLAFAAWKPKFELRIAELLDVHAVLGVGYGHSFPVNATYTLENGTYERTSNRGHSHVMPSAGGGVGLHLARWLQLPMTFYARYEVFSLAPYAKGFPPITFHAMTQFGVTFVFSD